MSDWARNNARTLLRTLHSFGVASDARILNFDGATLVGEIFTTEDNLRGGSFRGADLSEAQMSRIDLQGTDMRGATLVNAILDGADLRGADLREADLTGASLIGSDLRGALFENTVLVRTNMKHAVFDEGIELGALRQHGTALPNDEARICVRFAPTPHDVCVDVATALLAVSAGNSVQLWDLNASRWLTALPSRTGRVTCMCFFRYDGTLILAFGTDEGHVELWNIDSVVPYCDPFVAPNGSVTKLLSWDRGNGVNLTAFVDHSCRTWSVGSRVESCSYRFKDRGAILTALVMETEKSRAILGFDKDSWIEFDLASGEIYSEFGRGNNVILPNIKLAAGLLPQLGYHVTSFLPGSSHIYLFNVHPFAGLPHDIREVSVSPSSTDASITAAWLGTLGGSGVCIVADTLGEVIIKDLQSGSSTLLSGVSGEIKVIAAFDLPHGPIVVAITEDRLLAVWSLPSLRMIIRSTGEAGWVSHSIAGMTQNALVAGFDENKSVVAQALTFCEGVRASVPLARATMSDRVAITVDSIAGWYLIAGFRTNPFDIEIWVVPVLTEHQLLRDSIDLEHSWKLREFTEEGVAPPEALIDPSNMVALGQVASDVARSFDALGASGRFPMSGQRDALYSLSRSARRIRESVDLGPCAIAPRPGGVAFALQTGYEVSAGEVQDGAFQPFKKALVPHKYTHIVLTNVADDLSILLCATAAGFIEVRSHDSLSLLTSFTVECSTLRVFTVAVLGGNCVVMTAGDSEVVFHLLELEPLLRRSVKVPPRYSVLSIGRTSLPSRPITGYIDGMTGEAVLMCEDGGMPFFLLNGSRLSSRGWWYPVLDGSVAVNSGDSLFLRGAGSRNLLMSVGLCPLGWQQHAVSR